MKTSRKNQDFPYDCYGAFDLNEFDDSECLAEFRFYRNELPLLLEALQLPQSFNCHHGTICDGVEALCIRLRRFAYPCRYSDLIPRFGRSGSGAEYDFQPHDRYILSRTQSQNNSVEQYTAEPSTS